MGIIKCFECGNSFESNYLVRWGMTVCSECLEQADNSLLLRLSIARLREVSDNLDKDWERLPGQVTHNPESNLEVVVDTLSDILEGSRR